MTRIHLCLMVNKNKNRKKSLINDNTTGVLLRLKLVVGARLNFNLSVNCAGLLYCHLNVLFISYIIALFKCALTTNCDVSYSFCLRLQWTLHRPKAIKIPRHSTNVKLLSLDILLLSWSRLQICCLNSTLIVLSAHLSWS